MGAALQIPESPASGPRLIRRQLVLVDSTGRPFLDPALPLPRRRHPIANDAGFALFFEQLALPWFDDGIAAATGGISAATGLLAERRLVEQPRVQAQPPSAFGTPEPRSLPPRPRVVPVPSGPVWQPPNTKTPKRCTDPPRPCFRVVVPALVSPVVVALSTGTPCASPLRPPCGFVPPLPAVFPSDRCEGPSTPRVSLPVLASEVRVLSDRFQCAAKCAVISASACARFQIEAEARKTEREATTKRRAPSAYDGARPVLTLYECIDCEAAPTIAVREAGAQRVQARKAARRE